MGLKKLSKQENVKMKILIFAFPRLASSLTLSFVGLILFFLYTSIYKVNPFFVGIALGMGFISIAISQFVLGWVSDAKYTKLGRRKPYIIVLAPILAFSFTCLLLPRLFLQNTDEINLFIWLLIWDVIFEASYGVTTPYQSWLAEQFSVKDRPKVSQYENIFNILASGIIGVYSFVVLTKIKNEMLANPTSIPLDFFLPILIIGIMTILFFYTCVFLLPTEPKFKIESNLVQNLKEILRNKNYIKAIFMIGFTSFTLVQISNIMLNFIDNVVNITGIIQYAISGSIIFAGTIILLHFWRRFINKKGKKQVLKYVFYFGIFSLPFTFVFPLIPSELIRLIIGTVFLICIVSILSGWSLYPYIIYADLAEDGQKRTGELKAGIYTGFPSIILNLIQSLGIMFLGYLLSLPDILSLGYSIGYILWGPLCSFTLLLAWIYTKKHVKLDFEWENQDQNLKTD